MPKIQRMSELLSNQIAAGEVIERPASVVKELVENAIDAKSKHITVEVQEAGLRMIKVIDDGQGIAADELELAFERHATNKLIDEEDLFRIRTLGFRGEALPSIASVSELLIESAQESQPGKMLEVSASKIQDAHGASGRVGTKVTVENLFFNTPARLKYIKTQKTELAHISNLMNRFALSHPEISFHLIHEGSTLLQTVGNGDLRQAIAGVYGVKIAKEMKAIQGETVNFKVNGYVTLPDTTRASKAHLITIVNGRPIKNYALNRAIVDGYGSKLMVGRFPLAILLVEMDPLLLDVNVHPTKQQIRISNEEDLCQLVKESIDQEISKEVRIPNGFDNLPNPATDDSLTYEQTKFTYEDQRLSDQSVPKDPLFEESFSPYKNSNQESARTEPTFHHEESFGDKAQVQRDGNSEIHINESPLTTAERVMGEEASEKTFPELDYIGQMHGTYLFAQNEMGLYIIDQHAAQERIKYEYFRDTIASQGTDQQSLLVPIVLEYSTDDYLTINEHLTQLQEAGIFLEEFGPNTYVLKSHPSWFVKGQEEATVREMVDFLLTNKKLSTKAFREATAIMMSCKRSIKANHYLNDLEARALLNDLPKTQNPYNCPHGRPVLIQITLGQLEKMFKRIQDPH